MKKIERIIIKTFLVYFLSILGITIFISLLGILYDYMKIIIDKNLSVSFYLKIIRNFAFVTLPLSCSIATMLASVMTFARLSNTLEVCAIKSLGMSFKQMLWPLLKIMFIIGFFISLCSHYVAPRSLKNTFNIISDLKNINPSVMIKPGVFNNTLPGVSIFVKEKNNDGLLRNIIIYRHADRHNNNTSGEILLVADSAMMSVLNDGEELCISLHNGIDYIEDKESNSLVSIKFDKQNILVNMLAMNSTNNDSVRMQSTSQILKFIHQYQDDISNNTKQILNVIEQQYPDMSKNTFNNKIKKDIIASIIKNNFTKNIFPNADVIKKQHYNKFNNISYDFYQISYCKNIILSRIVELLICIFFLILGVAIGVLLKRGSFIIHLILAAIFISFYYIMDIIGQRILFTSYSTQYVGTVFGLLSLFPFIIFFCWHASRDSQILNDSIGQLIHKVLQLKNYITIKIKNMLSIMLKMFGHIYEKKSTN